MSDWLDEPDLDNCRRRKGKPTPEEIQQQREAFWEWFWGPFMWLTGGPLILIALLRLFGCDLSLGE